MEREKYYLAIKDSILIQHRRTTDADDAQFHFHDNYEIYLFLTGDVNFYVEQSLLHLKRGHLLVCNDCEIHRVQHFGKIPYERLVVHFDHRLVEGMSTSFTNLLACFQNHRPGFQNAVLIQEDQISTMMDMVHRLDDVSHSSGFGSDVLTVSYLSELLVYVNFLYRSYSEEPAAAVSGIIADIMEYIDSHLSAELSLYKISERFSIDRYYLSHLFKRQTGSTLYHYILIKKTAAAKRFLLGGCSVTEACARSGFNDYNNFIRTFKKITGVSPGKYLSGTSKQL